MFAGEGKGCERHPAGEAVGARRWEDGGAEGGAGDRTPHRDSGRVSIQVPDPSPWHVTRLHSKFGWNFANDRDAPDGFFIPIINLAAY